MAVAESCTGGALGAALVDVPGASHAFVGGVIAYSNKMKQDLLDVPAEVLAPGGPGAVSQACVVHMARGARLRCGADLAVAVSGIAGPGRAGTSKPVGEVWLALSRGDGHPLTQCLQLEGNRAQVRAEAVRRALDMVYLALRE